MTTKGNKVTDTDREVLRAFIKYSTMADVARSINMSQSAVRYHLLKVHKVTGLNPYVFCDMVKLCHKFVGDVYLCSPQ